MTRGALVIAFTLAACGARTLPDSPPERSDAGVDASPRLDAGPTMRDAGPPVMRDAGPPDPCVSDRDCAGRVCVGDTARAGTDLAPMPLTCGAIAPGTDEGGFCDRNEECGRGLCVVAGTCVRPCENDTDCTPAQRCQETWARSGDRSLQSLGACVNRFDLPPSATSAEAVLPGVLTGSLGGDLVDLPAMPVPSVVMLTATDSRAILMRLATRDASPVVLFDYEGLSYDGPAPLNPTYPEGEPIVVMLPNGPRGVTSAAGYRAVMASEGASSLRVETVTGTPTGTVLDLDFYYVGPRGLVPQGERGPPFLATEIDEAEAILARRGIRFGRIRQHEIVGGLRDRYAIVDAGASGFDLTELHELFQLSAGAGRPSVNIFFVREIDFALGVAGGVPGPPGAHGTSGSGIAIAVDLLVGPGLPEGVDVARTLAHELGHYLGLFHTSEYDGLIIEPLPDTPECRVEHDTDGDGYVLPSECEDAGARNLMFWAASGDGLTEQQGQVIRSLPVLKE